MERIDDILRGMRETADGAERGDCYGLRGLGTDSLRAYADRIEAAWERETRHPRLDIGQGDCAKCADEPDDSCGYYGEPDGCNFRTLAGIVRKVAAWHDGRATGRSSVVGNTAKMREALEQAQRVLHCAIAAEMLDGEDAHKALNAASAALSAPPRNCDVGTAEEQHSRFGRFCDKYEDCKECPVRRGGGSTSECGVYWAQMPYGRQ